MLASWAHALMWLDLIEAGAAPLAGPEPQLRGLSQTPPPCLASASGLTGTARGPHVPLHGLFFPCDPVSAHPHTGHHLLPPVPQPATRETHPLKPSQDHAAPLASSSHLPRDHLTCSSLSRCPLAPSPSVCLPIRWPLRTLLSMTTPFPAGLLLNSLHWRALLIFHPLNSSVLRLLWQNTFLAPSRLLLYFPLSAQ